MESGSKEAGQKWTEVAKLLNTYDGFKDMPKDQRSVRERFNKLMGEFRSKARSEINASGISPSPLSEIEILLEGISEIMLNIVHKETKKDDERTKALTIRNQATATWTKNRDEMTTSEEEECINASIENQGKKE